MSDLITNFVFLPSPHYLRQLGHCGPPLEVLCLAAKPFQEDWPHCKAVEFPSDTATRPS